MNTMANENPLVSIILPVYNGAAYLAEAIESIITQTYQNLEIIILNDGSTDASQAIISSFNDHRIIAIQQDNIGLAETLNKGIKLAKGEYMARQDADDISLPDRIQKQINYLQSHPEILVLGTRAKIFKDQGQYIGEHKHALNAAELHFDILFENPFVHSSIMFKKIHIEKLGYYNTDRSYFEDWELWSRFVEIGNIGNLKSNLVEYRHHEQGLSKSDYYFNADSRSLQTKKNIKHLLGYENQSISDIAALLHIDYKNYKGTTIETMYHELNQITNHLKKRYPSETKMISARQRQYQKIIKSRLNLYQREIYKHNSLKLLKLKIEYKVLGLHQALIND